MPPIKWPPDQHQARLDAIKKARAWYSGERMPEDSGSPFWQAGDPTKTADKGWQDVSTVSRSHRIHVPIAADLASTAADFLFSGGVRYQAKAKKDAKVVTEAADASGIIPLLTLGGERASGLGEVYLRLGWDEDEGRAICTLVEPDRVLPVIRWGRLQSAIVWAELEKHDGANWVHLEHHERGLIRHELWQSAGNGLTDQSSLTDHPATEALEDEVPLPSAIEDRMALLYVQNAEPRTPRAGGRADTAGTESIMGAADEAYTSLDRDVRLGKGRIVVDETMLTRTGALQAATFDMSAEVFAPIQGSGTEDPIKAVQFAIRTREHLEAVQSHIQRSISTAGYSPESLTMAQSGLPESAASRRLREAASIRTTNRKVLRWQPVVMEALSSLAVIQADMGGVDLAAPPVIVEIEPAITISAVDVADPVAKLVAARAVSIRTAVKLLHPTWDDPDVEREVAEIREDWAAMAGTGDTTDQTEELARMVQQVYLGVGKVITSDEARALLNRKGAGLTGPGPTGTPPA